MISDAWVGENGTVTGTFHYVTGYAGFNESDQEEQAGYYFPFTLVKSGETMTFKKNGIVSKDSIAWEANNVFRITRGDTFEVQVDGISIVTFSFTGAVFEPRAARQRAKKKAATQ